MACIYSVGFISLASIFLLLLQSRFGNFAPTHHLKISVQGNTPRLIVTSAEIGITSNIEVATSSSSRANATGTAILKDASTTTAPPSTLAPQSTKWLHKANELKLKSKSFAIPNERKRDKSTKEKAMAWESKSVMAASARPVVPPVAKTLEKIEKTAVKPKKVMKYSNLITTSKPREILGTEPSKYNEFKDETKRTTSLTTAPTSTLTSTLTSGATATSVSLERKVETIKSSEVTPGITTLLPGKLPPNSASMVDSGTVLAVTTIMTRKATTSTEASTTVAPIVSMTPIPSSSHDANDGSIKSLPEALSGGKNSLRMETISTFSMESTTTVITTEVSDDGNVESSSIKIVPKAKKANDVRQNTTLRRDIPQNLVTTNHGLLVATASPVWVMDTATHYVARAGDFKSSTSTTVTPPIDAKYVKPTDSGDDAAQQTVVKLIDLEKHEAAVDELRTKKQSHLDSGGHDGMKKTKKKQLLDKHFIPDVTTELNLDSSMVTSTLLPTSIFNSDTSAKADSVNMLQQKQPNIEKPVLMAPTLTPVLNGHSLGPIKIAERTFTFKPDSEESTKGLRHEASIESKLHDGRIVEIIAPTALLEQEPPTSAIFKTDVTSTAEPQANRKLPEAAVLSTTVFQVQEPAMSTTRKPINVRTTNSTLEEQRESRISDIQIEVYDSVVTPQRNHPTDENNTTNGAEQGRTRPPVLLPTTQERFTQYVVDRIESSTPDTIVNANLSFLGIGKPEPAAIEIHINVSEDMTNLNENIDFSYRQDENSYDFDSTNDITIKPPISQNDSTNNRNDDILVVEIIDNGDNSTETQGTNTVDAKPTITFRTSDTDVSDNDSSSQTADEIFMADAEKNGNRDSIKPPILPPPPPPNEPTIERDSDTIFYISNTEVKVGESPPNPVSGDGNEGNRQKQTRRTRLESQFFPASYMASTYPNTASGQQMQQKHLYEEDIILSPVRNTADSLKIFRSQNDNAPPLDITYVGESVIEVEQSSDGGSVTTIPSTNSALEPLGTQTSDVIIQPAMLPEMSIGVPVIGELPPQIELKEIDFMPNEANQQRSGVHETENNDIEENLSEGNNDIDRLVESSIQYGGDLIDEGADGDGGFDGVEGSYPFGNMAAMRRRTKNNDAADYAHFTMHYGVSNLRKNEMSVDVANPREVEHMDVGINENSTTTFQNGNETSASLNITYAIAERIESNATAFSTKKQTLEELRARGDLTHGPIESLIICVLLLLLSPLTLLIPCLSYRLFKRFFGVRLDAESSDVIIPNGNVARCDPAELTSKGDEDISRDARETKMHYTSERDGVFVVEVARGADSKIIPESPIAELVDDHLFVQQPKLNSNNNKSPTRKFEDEPAVRNSHEHVQIHQPPIESGTSNVERSLHQIEEVEEECLVSPKVETVVEMNFEPKANTGLSQSDLSSTSSADSNKRYNYGNQVLYTNDQTDYTSSSPVNINATPKRLPTVDYPQDDDHTSENGHNSNTTPEKSNRNEEHCEQQFVHDKENSSENEKHEISNNEKEEQVHEIGAVEKVEMEVKAEIEVDVDKEQILVEDNVSREDLKEDVEIEDVEIGAEKFATKEEAQEEIMSVSDVDCAMMESMTSETDTTQKLVQSKAIASNNPQQDNHADFESLAQASETDPEFTYDSLMSLPDPPSNEEMTQFGEFNGIETTQLDSLPPPPPPPTALLLTDENTNMPDIVAEIKLKSCQIQSINGNIEYSIGHGNLNRCEGSEQSIAQVLQLPAPIHVEEINSNGKIMPNSPLTPPESPPPSPPAQYSNGVMNGINGQLCTANVHAVAVNVNGS